MGKNYTVDNDTYASNPGNVRLKPLVWIRHDTKAMILALLLLIAIIGAFTIGLWFNPICLILIGVNFLYWLRKKEHFKSGDSNGGLVITLEPTLVAVATDLTKGFGSFPVVKVIRCNRLRNVRVGDRIATVALYGPTDDEVPHWSDFYPIPLAYASNNAAELKAAMNSYEAEQWQTLESHIRTLDKPYKEGLYRMKVAEGDWDDG